MLTRGLLSYLIRFGRAVRWNWDAWSGILPVFSVGFWQDLQYFNVIIARSVQSHFVLWSIWSG